MFATLRSLTRGSLVAGLLGLAAVAAPTAARAQTVTPEQALLNRQHGSSRGAAVAPQTQAVARVAAGVLDGEQALLNPLRTATIRLPQRPVASASDVAGATTADGVRALLNRSSL